MRRSFPADVNSLVGLTAPVVYTSVFLANQKSSILTLCKYTTPLSLQERVVMTLYERVIIEKALDIRKSHKLPFWEAIFYACIEAGDCRDTLLEATLFHNGMGTLQNHTRNEVESGILSRIANDEARNVGLSSEVVMDTGDRHHLMFIDFHCAITEDNTDLVHRVCRHLMPQGFVILDSGDSYHATSLELGTNDERIKLLGRALLLTPIIDSRYIAHQLQQNASSIRISRGGKCEQFPVAIGVYKP